MADDKDSFDFTGSFGNLRVYDDPATVKRIISEKGGPTTDQYWNPPNYAMARENSKEFAGRSTRVSLLNKGLSDIEHLKYVRCFNKIMTAGYHFLKQDDYNLISDFKAAGRDSFEVENDKLSVPKCKIFMDKKLRWWKNEVIIPGT